MAGRSTESLGVIEMPQATVMIGEPEPKPFEVRFTWWGLEEFFYDGQLLERRWNLGMSGQRQFQLPRHLVQVEVKIGRNEYFSRLLLDGKVYVEELFPQTKAQFERWKTPRHRLMRIAVFFVLGGIAGWYIASKL